MATSQTAAAIRPDSAPHRTTWDSYTAAWKATSADAKDAALAASTLPSFEYRDPLTHTTDRQALVDYMLGLHAQIPGAFFETTFFLAHHGRSIAKWNMCAADGRVLSDGVSYGEYDTAGQLLCATGFFEPPQG